MLNTQTSTQAVVQSDNQSSISNRIPETISLNKWEDTGFEWAGDVVPNSFERLAGILTD